MKNWKPFAIIGGVVLVLLWASSTYNNFQGLDEDVKASWSEVDNQYQRRSDLIPNLVEVVKGYAKHEKETLEGVISARASATQMKVDASSLSNPEKFAKYQAAQGEISQALGRLMVITEKYPELKADVQFRDLSSQIEGTENRITVARKRYIDQVANYNKSIRYFPGNIIAGAFLHLQPRETFKVAEATREAPKVKF